MLGAGISCLKIPQEQAVWMKGAASPPAAGSLDLGQAVIVEFAAACNEKAV